MDTSNAAVGGDFRRRPSASTFPQLSYPSSLPPPPAAYEDFEFSSPFNFDLFAAPSEQQASFPSEASRNSQSVETDTSSGRHTNDLNHFDSNHHLGGSTSSKMPSTSSLAQHNYASNPFSPQNLTSPSHFNDVPSPMPPHSSSATSSNQLNRTSHFSLQSPPNINDQHNTTFSTGRGGDRGGGPASSSSTSFVSGLQPPVDDAPSNPAPLFDDSESALFSSFLTTLDVDPFFLFNPVLPPGMPSPPPSMPRNDEEVRERDRLGSDVAAISLEKTPDWVRKLQAADNSARSRAGSSSERHQQDEEGWEDGEAEEGDQDELEAQGGGGRNGGKRSGTTQRARGGATSTGKKPRRSESMQNVQDAAGADDVEMGDGSRKSGAARARKPSRSSGTPGSRRMSTSGRNRDSISASAASPFASTSNNRSDSASLARGRSEEEEEGADQLEEDEDGGDQDDNDDDDSKQGKTLTDTQKRSNHIASEQKRRNAIRSGFKDLVDLLSAGEAASGIVVAPTEVENTDGKKKRGTKGTGRGRGRKGEVAAGGSKSVVLERAAAYILWLERGNEGLAAEVARVEATMMQMGISTV